MISTERDGYRTLALAGRALLLLAMTVTGALHPATSAAASGASACTPSDGLNFVCGPVANEDLARIPGTRWLILSGMNVGAPAHLYLLDARTKRATYLFPTQQPAMALDASLRTGCPGPPDLARLSTDGLNLRAGRGGQHLLYVANHGDRHAVELFRIDARGTVPKASWVGCVLMPAHTLANAVVPLADGGFIVSSFHDPDDKLAWEEMGRGENTGSLWEWHAGTGIKRLETGGISGANGVELSTDERWLYASAWSGSSLLVLDRRTGERHSIALGFLPDNIKREPGGTLLVGGQRSNVAQIAACNGPACPQDWIIARVDPVQGTVTPLVTRKGSSLVSYACGAVQVGNTLFITARSDQRVPYLPMDSLPSLR